MGGRDKKMKYLLSVIMLLSPIISMATPKARNYNVLPLSELIMDNLLDPDLMPETREVALLALKEIKPKDYDTQEKLVEIAETDSNLKVRKRAIYTLGESKLRNPIIQARLLDLAISDSNPSIRKAVFYALGESKSINYMIQNKIVKVFTDHKMSTKYLDFFKNKRAGLCKKTFNKMLPNGRKSLSN